MPPGEPKHVWSTRTSKIWLQQGAIIWNNACIVTHNDELLNRLFSTFQIKRTKNVELRFVLWALLPWRPVQRWHRSFFEDHLKCKRKTIFGKALMWSLLRRTLISKDENKRSRGVTMTWPSREHVYTTVCTREVVALADSSSCGNNLWYLWWPPSCPALKSTSR